MVVEGRFEGLYPYLYNLMWVGRRHEKISNIQAIQETEVSTLA